jgi:hypothetical protein
MDKIKKFILPCSENDFKPGCLNDRFLFSYVIFLVILKIFSLIYIFYIPQTPFFADISSSALIEMTNQERTTLGLSPLQVNEELNLAARMKAQDMLNNNYFSHYSPQGVSPWHWFQVAGYNYQHAGENLAIGFWDAYETHNAWYDSATHRANMIDPKFKEIGIAVVEGNWQGVTTYVVVQLFGTKPVLATVPKPTVPNTTPETVVPETEILGQEEYSEPTLFISALPDGHQIATKIVVNYSDWVETIILFSLFFFGFLIILSIFISFDQCTDVTVRSFVYLIIILALYLFDRQLFIDLIDWNITIY